MMEEKKYPWNLKIQLNFGWELNKSDSNKLMTPLQFFPIRERLSLFVSVVLAMKLT